MLCIASPPNLAANCRLSVSARSRPQCRAGVHARRSALASPHRKPPIPPAQEHPSTSRPPSPQPQASKASPARGGAAAGGGGVPHLAPPIPFRVAALPRSPRSPHTLPRHLPAKGPMLCIASPPNLAANCRLPVAARSRPQCRAGVHARRSSLASPHRKPPPAQIYNMPPPHLTPLSRHTRFRRPPPPPQTSKASPARGGAAAGGGGVPHLALPIPFRVAAFPRHRTPCTDPRRFATCLPFPAAKQKPRPGFSPDRDLRVSFSIVSAAAPAWFAAVYRVTPRRPAPAG